MVSARLYFQRHDDDMPLHHTPPFFIFFPRSPCSYECQAQFGDSEDGRTVDLNGIIAPAFKVRVHPRAGWVSVCVCVCRCAVDLPSLSFRQFHGLQRHRGIAGMVKETYASIAGTTGAQAMFQVRFLF